MFLCCFGYYHYINIFNGFLVMGKFKDEHGKSRVGLFLNKAAPELLNVVSTLTGISSLKDLAGVITGSKELSSEQKEHALKLLEMDMEEMREVTKRWQSDMVSDSWMSKNIRPYTLAFLTFLLSIIMIIDSTDYFQFNVKPEYIDLLKALLITVYFAYFGSRGYEKAKKIKNKREL